MPAPDEEMAAVLQALRDVLTKGDTPSTLLPSNENNREIFQALIAEMTALSSFSDCLAKGDLSPDFRQKGRMAGNFKALQANMRHMTWQAQEIAKGDYTQRLSFLGDFSTAFNIMVEGLEKARTEREEHEKVLAEKNKELISEIDVRKYAEAALRRAGLYNRSLIEASTDPMVTIAEDGKITDLNASTEKITGCNRTVMVGTDFSEYFTNPQKAREGYQKAFSEGSVMNYLLDIRHKDGSITPVLYNATVFRDESGKVRGVFAAARDITEQMKAQAAVRESEETIRLLLESTSEAIYGIDLELNCTFINPACVRMLGYTQTDELLKTNMHNKIHHSFADGTPMPREQCLFFQAYQRGESAHSDHEVFWRKDGTFFPAEVWSHPVKKDGVMVGHVVTFVDVTERKKMENEIKASLGEKEMLLKEIHHRVKNNMQVISSLLQLQSQSQKDEGTKMLFKEAMSRIKSIALVHEQLYRSDNLSQIEYGGYLRKMFSPLFESYKADARRIAMVIEADNVMVTIEKAVPCSLIVNEMMSNSLKYAFPGERKGEIRIRFSLDKSKENYVLDYSDNGIGLPEGFVPGKTGSLGTTLINGLTKQLKGTLAMVPGLGVHYVITFPSQDMKGK